MSILRKPLLVEKLRKFRKTVLDNGGKIGTQLRVVDFAYNNSCNLKCEHCSTESPLGKTTRHRISLEKLSDFADQAHDLGVYEFNLYGGELLINKKKLFELIKAVKPERFYTYLTSNGYFLDEDTANELAEAGIDRVSISIDSFDEKIHDEFRGVKGSYQKAMQALDYVKKAGMAPFLNITFGHYNAFSKDIEELCQFSKDRGYNTFINIAIPSGNWQGNLDVMIDEKDRERLLYLRKKYGNVLRDLWNPFDKNKEKVLGCQTISKMYITPNGDVLVCSFLHIKIGNIYEQSLKEIVDYGFSIKHFRNYSDVCLAGENREFVNKYMLEDMSIFNPLDARKVFADEDYVD